MALSYWKYTKNTSSQLSMLRKFKFSLSRHNLEAIYFTTFESVFLWDILGNCVCYQYLMRLSEYKYKLELAIGIIQSRRSGCGIVLFLVTRYFRVGLNNYQFYRNPYHPLCLWKSFNTSGLSIRYAYEKALTHPVHHFSRALENLWKIPCTKGIEVRNIGLVIARPVHYIV
jgi:hypothetical protein